MLKAAQADRHGHLPRETPGTSTPASNGRRFVRGAKRSSTSCRGEMVRKIALPGDLGISRVSIRGHDPYRARRDRYAIDSDRRA